MSAWSLSTRRFVAIFHRAADHAGAVVGPLLAFGLLAVAGLGMRTVFWLAAVPGGLFTLPDHAGKTAKPGQ